MFYGQLFQHILKIYCFDDESESLKAESDELILTRSLCLFKPSAIKRTKYEDEGFLRAVGRQYPHFDRFGCSAERFAADIKAETVLD
jgi:hypothetical protein